MITEMRAEMALPRAGAGQGEVGFTGTISDFQAVGMDGGNGCRATRLY